MEGSDSTVYNYDYGNPFYESRQNPRNWKLCQFLADLQFFVPAKVVYLTVQNEEIGLHLCYEYVRNLK